MRMTLALAVAGALAATGASAQMGGIQKPVSIGVRAGVFMPKNSDAGKNWLALGVDARVNVPFLPVIGGQEIAIDYLAKNSNTRMVGVTLVQRYSSPTIVPGQPKPYFGMGFGVYNVRWKTGTTDEKKTVAGLKALLGMDFKTYYIQGDYHYPFGSDTSKARGFAVTAGLRF